MMGQRAIYADDFGDYTAKDLPGTIGAAITSHQTALKGRHAVPVTSVLDLREWREVRDWAYGTTQKTLAKV